jgi:amino acid permease
VIDCYNILLFKTILRMASRTANLPWRQLSIDLRSISIGGGPHGGYIGRKYWHDPGAFAAGFKGVVAVFVNAAFAFSGTELSGLADAETKNPRKMLPSVLSKFFGE